MDMRTQLTVIMSSAIFIEMNDLQESFERYMQPARNLQWAKTETDRNKAQKKLDNKRRELLNKMDGLKSNLIIVEATIVGLVAALGTNGTDLFLKLSLTFLIISILSGVFSYYFSVDASYWFTFTEQAWLDTHYKNLFRFIDKKRYDEFLLFLGEIDVNRGGSGTTNKILQRTGLSADRLDISFYVGFLIAMLFLSYSIWIS